MKDKIYLRPEKPHREIDKIPSSLENAGIIIMAAIAVVLAIAAIIYFGRVPIL